MLDPFFRVCRRNRAYARGLLQAHDGIGHLFESSAEFTAAIVPCSVSPTDTGMAIPSGAVAANRPAADDASENCAG
jgi:hypothetical protein